MPCGGKGLGKISVPGQTHTPMPEFARFQHGHADARTKFKLFTITNAAAGAYEPLNLGAEAAKLVGPRPIKHQRQRREQQKLHLAASGACSQQARLQYAGIVGYQQRSLG